MNILIFLPILVWEYSYDILRLRIYHGTLYCLVHVFCVPCICITCNVYLSKYISIEQGAVWVIIVILASFFFRLEKDSFTDFHLLNAKLYSFQNLSLGFILKILLKFRKLQSQYSYKVYFYNWKKKKKSVPIWERTWPRILDVSLRPCKLRITVNSRCMSL